MQSCNGEDSQKFEVLDGLFPVYDVITALNDKCVGKDTETGNAYLRQCTHGKHGWPVARKWLQ